MKKEHFEILLEDVKGMFELLMEGHSGLSKELKDFRQEMEEFRRENDFAHREIFKELKKLHKQDKKQEKVTDGLDQRVSRLEAARI